jgi:hypothetical protein
MNYEETVVPLQPDEVARLILSMPSVSTRAPSS